MHLSVFTDTRDALSFHFLVHTTLDIFTSRLPSKANGDSDFGLLYAVDDEVALYGWLTNTGIKIVVAVETPAGADSDGGGGGGMGVRDGELKGVSLLLLFSSLSFLGGKGRIARLEEADVRW